MPTSQPGLDNSSLRLSSQMKTNQFSIQGARPSAAVLIPWLEYLFGFQIHSRKVLFVARKLSLSTLQELWWTTSGLRVQARNLLVANDKNTNYANLKRRRNGWPTFLRRSSVLGSLGLCPFFSLCALCFGWGCVWAESCSSEGRGYPIGPDWIIGLCVAPID